jgi:predicted RNase H-like nuclease
MDPYVLGIDGCRAGWIGLMARRSGSVEWRLFGSLQEVWSLPTLPDLALVDVPIGLSDSGPRRCDREARRRLGRRACCVFSAPVRPVLACTDHAAAKAASIDASGSSIGVQSWNIVPKIRDADDQLRPDPSRQRVMRECHPELCFAMLGDGPIPVGKKRAPGRAARLDVLRRWLPDADGDYDNGLSRFKRGEVAADDLIDAMVCAVTAAGIWDASLRSLPNEPERDACGLAMEMVYRDRAAISPPVP